MASSSSHSQLVYGRTPLAQIVSSIVLELYSESTPASTILQCFPSEPRKLALNARGWLHTVYKQVLLWSDLKKKTIKSLQSIPNVSGTEK